MQRVQPFPKPFSLTCLLVAAVAGVAAFLPFSVNTSAWSAVTLRVPGDQGNWWHFLAGAPFFLMFPMMWLLVRSLLSLKATAVERRILWGLASISVCGTLLVEVPVIFRMGNLVQMGLRRQLELVVPSVGLLVLCAAVLISRRKMLNADSATLVGLCAAYLANAAFCLGMYAPYAPQSGWYTTMVLIWLIALQVLWIFMASFHNVVPD